MEIQSWNKELALANAQFKRLFNNISITKNGKTTNFKCVLGNRSRIFKNLENPTKSAEYSLPMIIVQRTGITKNNERLANMNNEVKYAPHSKMRSYDLYTPVPVDISYQVTIVSKYQEHIDRAVSNFIPFFNKDLFVRCEHPKFEGLYFTNQVIMEDSMTEEHPDEIDPSADDIVQMTVNFIYKTYIFSGTKRAVLVPKTEISTYLSTFISSYVYELTNDDKKNIEQFLSTKLSTTLTSEVTVPCSVEVPIESADPFPEISGFSPSINTLYVGLYPTPLLSQYIPHIKWVDSLCAQGIDERPWVDRFSWKIDEEGNLEYDDENLHYLSEETETIVSQLSAG